MCTGASLAAGPKQKLQGAGCAYLHAGSEGSGDLKGQVVSLLQPMRSHNFLQLLQSRRQATCIPQRCPEQPLWVLRLVHGPRWRGKMVPQAGCNGFCQGLLRPRAWGHLDYPPLIQPAELCASLAFHRNALENASCCNDRAVLTVLL